jgi:hypothetical protein
MDRLKFQKNGVRLASRLLLGLAVLSAPLIVGCSGGSNSDNGAEYDGFFVVSDDTVGTLELSVASTSFGVSQTAGFSVSVKDPSGTPVRNIPVVCDTQSGLALIEPNTGQGMTDTYGNMSGTIGCEAPGSLQFGCRLGGGVNLRKFVQIACQGPVPAGFVGFPNSGGGGIGGGVDTPDDGDAGGVGTEGIRLIEIAFNDTGDATPLTNQTLVIDTRQKNCETDPEEDPDCEPFFDSIISFKLVNNSNQSIQISGYNYTIPNADGSGTSFTSSTIVPTPIEGGNAITANGGEATFAALFTDITTGSGVCGAEKRFITSSSSIPSTLGLRTVTVRVSGRNENGDTFTKTGQVSVSFDVYDYCG